MKTADCFEGNSRQMSGHLGLEAEENIQNISIRMVCVETEIRIFNLLKTQPDSLQCIRLFSRKNVDWELKSDCWT
jgi:hypothetical protein